MGSLITVDYTSNVSGVATLRLDVYLGSRFIDSAETRICILGEVADEVMTGEDLAITYELADTGMTDPSLTHVFIYATRFGTYVDIVNFIEISPVDGVIVEQGSDYLGITLHLEIEYEDSLKEPIKLLIWDEYGSSEILEIFLPSNDTNGKEDEFIPSEPIVEEKNDRDISPIIAFIVISLCLTIILIIVGFVIYEKRQNEMNWRSVEPASVQDRP
jgi:hypothetical protein